jgi:hypothetical protein
MRLSRTGPKPPAAISLHATPRTEVCCTEFKESNKETADSRANKAVFFVFGRCAQENASEGDYNSNLEARRATHARKGFDMARCRRLGPKEMSEVNNESSTANCSFGLQSENKGGREASSCRT